MKRKSSTTKLLNRIFCASSHLRQEVGMPLSHPQPLDGTQNISKPPRTSRDSWCLSLLGLFGSSEPRSRRRRSRPARQELHTRIPNTLHGTGRELHTTPEIRPNVLTHGVYIFHLPRSSISPSSPDEVDEDRTRNRVTSRLATGWLALAGDGHVQWTSADLLQARDTSMEFRILDALQASYFDASFWG